MFPGNRAENQYSKVQDISSDYSFQGWFQGHRLGSSEGGRAPHPSHLEYYQCFLTAIIINTNCDGFRATFRFLKIWKSLKFQKNTSQKITIKGLLTEFPTSISIFIHQKQF